MSIIINSHKIPSTISAPAAYLSHNLQHWRLQFCKAWQCFVAMETHWSGTGMTWLTFDPLFILNSSTLMDSKIQRAYSWKRKSSFMNCFHFLTYIHIYAVIINSLSANVKITSTAHRYNMLGEKYYHNKKYQGISRPQPREENCFPSIRSGSPVSSSRAREDFQSTWKGTSDKTESSLSAAHRARQAEQGLGLEHAPPSSEHDSGVALFQSPCHVGQAKTNVMSAR